MATTAILAAPGEFLPILFVLIAIATGIINFVKERRAAAERDAGNFANRGGHGNVDGELQSEIDAFLQEVSPEQYEEARPARQDNAQQQRRRQKKANSDEEAERRRRVRARREHERKQEAEDRKRQSVRKRHLETSDLNEVSDRHNVANRHVESTVKDRHLEDHIDGPSDSTLSSAVSTGGNSVAELLRTPGGIRNAILLNEILGPPLANRPDRKR